MRMSQHELEACDNNRVFTHFGLSSQLINKSCNKYRTDKKYLPSLNTSFLKDLGMNSLCA